MPKLMFNILNAVTEPRRTHKSGTQLITKCLPPAFELMTRWKKKKSVGPPKTMQSGGLKNKFWWKRQPRQLGGVPCPGKTKKKKVSGGCAGATVAPALVRGVYGSVVVVLWVSRPGGGYAYQKKYNTDNQIIYNGISLKREENFRRGGRGRGPRPEIRFQIRKTAGVRRETSKITNEKKNGSCG